MPSCLILGGAVCVWGDAAVALKLFTPDAIIAVNDIGIDWPERLDHWVTLHPGPPKNNKSSTWPGIIEARRQRAARSFPGIAETWGHKPAPGIDRHTPDWGGSSALLAVKVARVVLGCDRIVLAGVPMDATHHYKRNVPFPTPHYSLFRNAWLRRKGELAPHLRSMSGWTRDVFGAPAYDWLQAQAVQCAQASLA